MRIVSLLPSATEIACALGLREELVGITHECDYPPGIAREKTVVIESCLGPGGKDLPPGEIDARIRETLARGEGVYRFKPGVLEELRPDLVVTQGLCDVCAVPREHLLETIRGLRPAPEVLSLDPTRLDEVFGDVLRLGRAAGRAGRAAELAAELRARVEAVAARTRALPESARPRVACLEWLDPLFSAGHWVPEMVELAGGRDALAVAGKPSERIAWEAVVAARPDVVLVMPCGYDAAKAERELRLVSNRPGWDGLPAVREKRVYFLDANAHFSRPGPRLADGLERLSRILHPNLFTSPSRRFIPGSPQ
ncbi:MAG: cobalamin-binding protein [Planctomycetota bacterium]|nr:cobalamin-binding protein [Planctomycetota bacterium]